MKNKIKSLYLTLLLIFINFQNTYATTKATKATKATKGTTIEKFRGTTPTGDAANTIKSLGGKVIMIASTIGSIISILVLLIMGIKYMMGSVEERAEYKKTLLPYIIGAILVFAASSIAQIIYQIVTNII